VKELSGISEFLDNLRVAPFDSDPTVDDTDGDGFDVDRKLNNEFCNPRGSLRMPFHGIGL
ncbi:MAG: hypothetical protein Q4E74_11315, partial [Ruminococcus sp.]|nr:hypothetical protein [Ruminococcus sp.]